MSNKKRNDAEERRNASDYYRLHTKAVDDLIHANEENTPKYSDKELNKYRKTSGFKIPQGAKIVLIKFWFPAAVCYFFIWGLGLYVSDILDMLFITGIALGVVTDLLTNNALRFFAETDGGNDRWIMFPKKGYMSYPLNIIYAWLLLFLVYTFYTMVNVSVSKLNGVPVMIAIGVEPVMFGLLYLGFDMLLITAKHLLLRIVSDAKNTAHK